METCTYKSIIVIPQGTQQRTRNTTRQAHITQSKCPKKAYQSSTLDYRTPPNLPGGTTYASTLPLRSQSAYTHDPQSNHIHQNGDYQRNQDTLIIARPPPGDVSEDRSKSRGLHGQSANPMQQVEQLGPHQDSWPLCAGEKVVVHLNEPKKETLQPGDSYFCVTQSHQGSVDVVLRHIKSKDKVIKDISLQADSKHAGIFNSSTMDNKDEKSDNIHSQSNEDIVELLSHCILAAEHGLERMTWDQVKLSAMGSSRDVVSGTGRKHNVRGSSDLQNTEIEYHPRKNHGKFVNAKNCTPLFFKVLREGAIMGVYS